MLSGRHKTHVNSRQHGEGDLTHLEQYFATLQDEPDVTMLAVNRNRDAKQRHAGHTQLESIRLSTTTQPAFMLSPLVNFIRASSDAVRRGSIDLHLHNNLSQLLGRRHKKAQYTHIRRHYHSRILI